MATVLLLSIYMLKPRASVLYNVLIFETKGLENFAEMSVLVCSVINLATSVLCSLINLATR